MTWAAPLTRANIHEYLGETYDLDARQHGAYALLTMRYLLVGPLPFDERRLSDIARVTKGVWRKRVWPALQEFFTLGDDGLIHHDGLDALETTTAQQAKRSAASSKAGRARWQKEAIRKAAEAAASHASNGAAHDAAHTDASESHTESDAISTVGASKIYADGTPFASPDAFSGASDASSASCAPSPSLASFTSFQPTDESTESK
jgi:uncharacterized protein YdaU (DUF1376 family)